MLERATVEPEPPQGANQLELARTLLALGTAQRRAQHKRDARETLRRAADRFERLGARLWAAKAQAELRRIGGRTASDDELSETERLIVELVVAGRKNRDVAAELSLSPNTVAWNLSKVYRKLGVGSRTELATRAGSCRSMPNYLVERYLPGHDRAWLESALARIPRGRREVTYLGSTYLPSDESCLCRFEAETAEDVRDANEVAGVPFARIVVAEELGVCQRGQTEKGDPR
jgi:DNA-binding CsgD family transcriptional regulator